MVREWVELRRCKDGEVAKVLTWIRGRTERVVKWFELRVKGKKGGQLSNSIDQSELKERAHLARGEEYCADG